MLHSDILPLQLHCISMFSADSSHHLLQHICTRWIQASLQKICSHKASILRLCMSFSIWLLLHRRWNYHYPYQAATSHTTEGSDTPTQARAGARSTSPHRHSQSPYKPTSLIYKSTAQTGRSPGGGGAARGGAKRAGEATHGETPRRLMVGPNWAGLIWAGPNWAGNVGTGGTGIEVATASSGRCSAADCTPA